MHRHTHKTALANNPALSWNMHCKHSWLIAEKLLNPVNNQIILPQYKQRWQRQTHTSEKDPCICWGFTKLKTVVGGKPDSASFFFFFKSCFKGGGKKYKHRQKGAQYVMRLNKWTQGKKTMWEKTDGSSFGDRWGCRQDCSHCRHWADLMPKRQGQMDKRREDKKKSRRNVI